MRVAYCLYGQPRLFKEGHENIIKFLRKNPNITVDFFYHTWVDQNIEYYECSPWRTISTEELKIDTNVVQKLNELYNPVSYHHESPIKFDTSFLMDTIVYKNSEQRLRAQSNNLISQIHSRQYVCDLLVKYIEVSGTIYDMVISSRFDFLREINIDLSQIDNKNLYTSCTLQPRQLIPEPFLITNVNTFTKIFNNMMDEKINNQIIEKIVNHYGEQLNLTMEAIFFTNYLYHFNNLENVIYTSLIPNFI